MRVNQIQIKSMYNVFTAQGRDDSSQNCGVSVQNCKVLDTADLIPVQSNFSTYLGRPRKQYARTIFMQSNLEGLINPGRGCWREMVHLRRAPYIIDI
jgi:Pectinesterase